MLNKSVVTFEDLNILIDHRESRAPYLHFLEEITPQVLVRTTLRAGDIQIGDLVIERKLLPDFYLTLNEGRLFKQLRKLKNSSRCHLLILEGTRPLNRTDQAGLSGLHIRITVGWQIPILYAQTPKETAHLIASIASQSIHASAGPVTPRPRNRNFAKQTVATRMLMQIPSLGFVKARNLLDHFKTLAGVLNASEKELLSVPGIGPSRANEILSIDSKTVD